MTKPDSHKQKRYNLLPYEAEFKIYCSAVIGMSPLSIKGYVSDFKFFIHWLQASHPDVSVEHVSQTMIQQYKQYLQASFPRSTSNRRLSTLRAFYAFLISQGVLTESPTRDVHNITEATPIPHIYTALVEDFMSNTNDREFGAKQHLQSTVLDFLSVSATPHEDHA